VISFIFYTGKLFFYQFLDFPFGIKITKSEDGDYHRIHSNINIDCEADSLGMPAGNLSLYKNGILLDTTTNKTLKFSLSPLQRKDTGVYHCVATNDVGSVNSTQETLKVTGNLS